MGLKSEKLAVIIARMGPYHVARIAALARAHGSDAVVALEVASFDRTYSWDPVDAAGLRRITLFTDLKYEAVTARHLARATVEVLDREKPSAVGVNGWGFPESRAALGWCRRNGRIAVLMSDSQEVDAPRVRVKEWLKQWIVGQCDSAFVAGMSSARYLQKLGMPPERIAFGYDVVDNDHFRHGAERVRDDVGARERLGLPSRYFLVVARFIAEKNLPALLRSYARYRALAGKGAWDLVLVGDGPLRKSLETTRVELGLVASVRLRGFLQYTELPAYYGLASAFVLPSASETWGLAVNEAMAAGLPVLVSNTCGAAELVTDGFNGWRFDPRDLEQLAGVLLRVTQLGEELADFGRASLRVVANYGPQRFARGFLEAVELGREGIRSRRRARLPGWLLGG